MKKTIILFLCIIEIISSFTIGGVKAEDGCRQKSLYAYSDENESFDEFARNNFYEMLLVQEYDFDISTVYLGHGIRVFGSDSQSEVLYPVWQSWGLAG